MMLTGVHNLKRSDSSSEANQRSGESDEDSRR